MLGWMLIFTLMVLGVTTSVIKGDIGAASGIATSAVFGFLLVISAFTLLLRGRA